MRDGALWDFAATRLSPPNPPAGEFAFFSPHGGAGGASAGHQLQIGIDKEIPPQHLPLSPSPHLPISTFPLAAVIPVLFISTPPPMSR
ncbi:MAG: hypothetical protein KDJ52_07215 [Anaerolineae bacterium]|nr:hypothetical protein [Anaerolineae bacterium]